MSTLIQDLSELFGEKTASTDATRAVKVPNKTPKSKKVPSTVKLEGNPESLDEDKHSILQHLALAAQVAGVDLDDEASFKAFYDELRDAVRDKSRLRSTMRTWTAGKARATAKALKTAVV